jgi:4-amino-4-deoxy-L-arabinose transferase-like glycosyltransferase
LPARFGKITFTMAVGAPSIRKTRRSLFPDNSRAAPAVRLPSSQFGLNTNHGKSQNRRLHSSIVMSILLFGAVLAAFSGALNNDFVGYDDPQYVTSNGHVRQGLQDPLWALRSTEAGNWHPLTWLSHMLDCQLFGLKPAGHHLTSILLHAGTTVLLFLFLRRSTGEHWLSAIAAALFGLHPLRVESVAWVAERKDVLCAFFWIAALWSYSKYVEARREQSSSHSTAARNWYI